MTEFAYHVLEQDAEHACIQVNFPLEACDSLVDLTRDQNREDHLSTGKGLLQGIAVFAAVGTCVSIWKEGFGPTEGSFKIHAPVRVGDSVLVTVSQTAKREVMCECRHENGDLVMSVTLGLVSLKMITRGLAPRPLSEVAA